jgi:hypothetical protein
MKVERSKVRTLQARILEKARIYMALGVFYLGCYWLRKKRKIKKAAKRRINVKKPL